MFRVSMLLLMPLLFVWVPSVFGHDAGIVWNTADYGPSDPLCADDTENCHYDKDGYHFHHFTFAERLSPSGNLYTPKVSTSTPLDNGVPRRPPPEPDPPAPRTPRPPPELHPAVDGEEHSHSILHFHPYDNERLHYHIVTHTHARQLPHNYSLDETHGLSGSSGTRSRSNNGGDQEQPPIQHSPPQQVEPQQAIPQGAVPQLPANQHPAPQQPVNPPTVQPQSTPQQSVQQPSGNQLPVEQQSVQQPSGNQPIVTQPTAQPVSSATPAAEPASQGQPQTSQPVSEDTPIKPITQPQQKPVITEYMLRDYSRSGGAGLPQWIEIYNGNLQEIDLKGYQFTYAWRNTANSPYRYKTETIDSFVIPAGEAKIIIGKKIEAREARWNTVAGLSDEDIWVIPSEENWVSLKDGWHLADPSGKAIYRIGGAFEEKPAAAAWDDSISWRGNVRVPPHTSEGFRVSYQSLPSESADEDHFYGNVEDRSAVAVVVNSKTTYAFVGKSSPGFYRPVSVAPAAPSLVRPKRIGTWAGLKK